MPVLEERARLANTAGEGALLGERARLASAG